MSCDCRNGDVPDGLALIGDCPPLVPPRKIAKVFEASIGWVGWNFDGGPIGYITKTVAWTDGNGSHTGVYERKRPSEGGGTHFSGEEEFQTDWELISESTTVRTYRDGTGDFKTETLSGAFDPTAELGALIDAVSARMGNEQLPASNELYHAFYELGTGRVVLEGTGIDYNGPRTLSARFADIHDVCFTDAFQAKGVSSGDFAVQWKASEVWITAPWYLRTYPVLTRFAPDGHTQVRNVCCRPIGSSSDYLNCGDVAPNCEVRQDDSINGNDPPVTLIPGGFNGVGYHAGFTPCNLAP